jgi:uncharacterized protein (DUF2062 family)
MKPLKPSDKINLLSLASGAAIVAFLLWIGLHWIIAVVLGLVLTTVIREAARKKIIDR